MSSGLPIVRALAAAAALTFALWGGAAPVQASPDTFRMALGNLVGGSLDTALSPMTATTATIDNFPHVSDSAAGQSAYAVFGWPGQLIVQALAGGLRSASGALQLVPGLALFFVKADLDERFDPFAGGEALVDLENPLGAEPPWLKYVLVLTPFTIDPKFGITATIGQYGPNASTGK